MVKYTEEQYYAMVVHVETDIMEAELHNSRIIKHLEEGDTAMALHEELQEALLHAVGIMTSIIELAEHRQEMNSG